MPISIQRLCRFEEVEKITTMVVDGFQYNDCVGSSYGDFGGQKTLRGFQYNDCVGSRHQISSSHWRYADFNTTIVSVRVNKYGLIKPYTIFQYNDCVGSRGYIILASRRKLKFQYNDCVGSSVI